MLLETVCVTLSSEGIFYAENAGYSSGDFVVNNCFIIFPNDINTEFLGVNVRCISGFGGFVLTTMSSLLSSYGSDSRPSGESRSPLIKVPLELLTSLMNI